jgi:hypothetical protein
MARNVIDPSGQPLLPIYERQGYIKVYSPRDLVEEGGRLAEGVLSTRELIEELLRLPPPVAGPFHVLDVRA